MRSMTAVACILCVFGLAIPPVANSAEFAAGIYRVVAEGQGKSVARTSGGAVDLGERLTGNFGDVSIWSLTNENDRFRISMQHAGPLDVRGRVAVHADGVCEVISSHSDPDNAGKVDLIADVAGYANAKKMAAALMAKLQERTHPEHQLLVSWHPLKQSYKVGDAPELELTIKNVGSTKIHFVEGGKQRGPRDNQFGFTAFAGAGYGKPIPDTGDPTNFGGIGAFRELKPGDVFRKRVDLSKWFKFEQPDTYRITGMYQLELQDEDYSPRVLWNEFATGRCLVRIEK